MLALITGASSGIGRDMAYYLANLGYDLILVARRKERLEEIKNNVNVNVKIIDTDLLIEENVFKLYEKVKKENIDILINNAGFGLFGIFSKTDLNRELEMIDLNIKTYHILTKLFLTDFLKKDSGYILNVCSSAGFLAGPRLSTYYRVDVVPPSLTVGYLVGVFGLCRLAFSNLCGNIVGAGQFTLTIEDNGLLLVDERVNLVLFHIRFNFK